MGQPGAERMPSNHSNESQSQSKRNEAQGVGHVIACMYAIQATCCNVAMQHFRTRRVVCHSQSGWFWCMLNRGEPKRGIRVPRKRDRRRVGGRGRAREMQKYFGQLLCSEAGAIWHCQERSAIVMPRGSLASALPTQRAGHRKEEREHWGRVAGEPRGSRSRRGPALPSRTDEGPNRGEAIQGQPEIGKGGGNGIELTFRHSGELLRPQAVHTRPSCVSFRRCYEPKG
jgi:hypothetical protein